MNLIRTLRLPERGHTFSLDKVTINEKQKRKDKESILNLSTLLVSSLMIYLPDNTW